MNKKLVKVTCWFCGKKFEIEKANVKADELFCSDECRVDNLRQEIELEKIDKVVKLKREATNDQRHQKGWPRNSSRPSPNNQKV